MESQCSPKAWKNKWVLQGNSSNAVSQRMAKTMAFQTELALLFLREKSLFQIHGSLQKKKKGRPIYPLQNIKPEQTVKISPQTSQDNTELACMPCENHVILWLRHKPENLVHDLAIRLHFMWTSQAPQLLSSIPPSTVPHYRYWGFLAQRNNNKKTLCFETQQHIISSLLFISHHHLSFKFQLGNTDPKVTSQKMCHWELPLCWPKPSTWELFSAAGKRQAIHTCSRFQTVDLPETNLFPLSALQKGVMLFSQVEPAEENRAHSCLDVCNHRII